MKFKKYKAEFKVEKFYDVEVEVPADTPDIDVAEKIVEIMQEDYLCGNMDNEEEKDCQFKIDEIEEIK
mgnify:CR=1 FL=1